MPLLRQGADRPNVGFMAGPAAPGFGAARKRQFRLEMRPAQHQGRRNRKQPPSDRLRSGYKRKAGGKHRFQSHYKLSLQPAGLGTPHLRKFYSHCGTAGRGEKSVGREPYSHISNLKQQSEQYEKGLAPTNPKTGRREALFCVCIFLALVIPVPAPFAP